MQKLLILMPLMWLATVALSAPITYQGQLQDANGPVSDLAHMEFRLFDSEESGTQLGSELTFGQVGVVDGLFQVDLDFGSVFDGSPVYLEVTVEGQVLSPRQRIAPTPMALFAINADGGGDFPLDYDESSGLLEFEHNSQGFRIYPHGNLDFPPRIAAGHSANEVQGNGATVLSGGRGIYPNRATSVMAWIGGGIDNLASGEASMVVGGLQNVASSDISIVVGGSENIASGPYSFVGGGKENQAEGEYSTISGGITNTNSGDMGTIAGGWWNTLSGDYATMSGGAFSAAQGAYSTIGGGVSHLTQGEYATIPGGRWNSANGDYSFAAGRRAKAEHDGVWIWADSRDADFVSTGADQFLVRARGGVGINTDSPTRMLHMKGNSSLTPTMLFESEEAPEDRRVAALFMNVTTGHMSIGRMNDEGTSLASTHLQIRSDDGYVGIGRTGSSISHPLHMGSGAHVTAGGTWTNSSDADAKTDFQPVNPDEILAGVVQMPITYWEYKNDQGVRHLGPTAQDFAAAFQLGHGDKTISTVDVNGVALAAIQALYARQTALETENAELRRLAERNAELEDRLAALESLLIDHGQMAEVSP
jgi:trimeric autotransporter adhesin